MSPRARPLDRVVAVAADRVSCRRYSLVGAALMRVVLGSVAVLFYLANYTDRRMLFGPEGVWPWEPFTKSMALESFSLYSLSASPYWFELLFHGGLALAVLFTVGWLPRWVLPAHYVFLWSLFERNPAILDGGDNLMVLVLVFLFFVDTGEHLALRGHVRSAGVLGWSLLSRRLGTVAHNAGILAIVLQVATLYLASALYKIQGELWQSGTALYYILRVNEYTLPGWSEHIYESAVLVTLLTYGTVLFQLAFPFLLLNRVTRYLAVLGAIAMHLGIAIIMGLVSFSLTVIAADLVVVSDARYLALLGKVKAYGKVRRRAVAANPSRVS